MLGLCFSSRFAVIVTTVLVGAGLFLAPVASSWFFGNGPPDGFWLSSPLVCVSTAGMAGAGTGGFPSNAAWWVVNWAVLYGVAALVLLAVAARMVERRPGTEWHAALGPAGMAWHRGPAADRKPAVQGWDE